MSKSRIDGLKILLQKFALLRNAVMDATQLGSYSKALAETFADEDDTLKVLDRLVKSPRGEYEAKIPELGTLLGMVRQVGRDRWSREASARHLREYDELKAQCERERLEDEGKPKPEPSEVEVRLGRILAVASKDESRRLAYTPPEGHDPRAIAERVKRELREQATSTPAA